MSVLLLALAAAGLLALAARLVRSLLGLGLAAAETAALSGLAEASTRRGDLTALAEQRAREKALRRARLRAALLVALWLALLAVPPMTGWAREAYAAASVLWLLPRQRLLPRRPAAGSDSPRG